MSAGQTILYYGSMLLSTVWKTVTNFGTLWETGKYGTLLMGVLIILAFTFISIKISSMFENMHPVAKFLIILVVIGALSYGAYLYNGGESISLGGQDMPVEPTTDNQTFPVVDLTGGSYETS